MGANLLIAHSDDFGKSHVLYPGILCLDTVSNAKDGELAQFWIEFELLQQGTRKDIEW